MGLLWYEPRRGAGSIPRGAAQAGGWPGEPHEADRTRAGLLAAWV